MQKFTSTGTFLRTWGRDVVQPGGFGDLGVVAEVCTEAADCQQGDGGALGGELYLPFNVAIDPDGNVHVVEDFNNRIQKFNSVGDFQRAWGKDVVTGGGTGFEICTAAASCKQGAIGGVLGGELRQPTGVAADDAGSLYVAAELNHRIEVFDLSGNWQFAWGKDVVTSGGTGFEICTVATSCKSGVSGGLGGELSLPRGLAADSAGDLYVVDGSNDRVQKFTTTAPLPPLPPPPPPEIDTGLPETTIIAGPKPKTKSKSARFEFASNEPGSKFECKLDDGAFEPCSSPFSTKVKKGRHTFEVRAIDAAGNVDPTPATHTWKVKKKKKKK